MCIKILILDQQTPYIIIFIMGFLKDENLKFEKI
jgi:hypothetical protein